MICPLAFGSTGTKPIDADCLREDALLAPGVQRWSDVELGGIEPIDDLDLWLATVVDSFGLVIANKAAIDSGRLPAAARHLLARATDQMAVVPGTPAALRIIR
ncbi:MAG: hypothetical protein ACRDS1_01085 [Pseudonocardiaceae bacterium]